MPTVCWVLGKVPENKIKKSSPCIQGAGVLWGWGSGGSKISDYNGVDDALDGGAGCYGSGYKRHCMVALRL